MTTLDALTNSALPLNRKERFYTGTVLHQLVCCGDFRHFDQFTSLLGAGRLTLKSNPDDTDILFFAEYGFAESVVGDTSDRFPGRPLKKETPDLLVYLAGPAARLRAVEAKMYHRPTAKDLNLQLEIQRTLVLFLAGQLGVTDEHVHHAALLPDSLAIEVGPLACPTITWEAVLDAYADVAPKYWCGMLRTALDRYEALRSAHVTSEAFIERITARNAASSDTEPTE